MKLYNTTHGIIIEYQDTKFKADETWDTLVNRDNLEAYLLSKVEHLSTITDDEEELWLSDASLLPPIASQEIWAAGVTYLQSRDARMEESETAASLYDLVYEAERPELFFKATPQRVSGYGQELYIRKDSAWNVPEPELTLFISTSGIIQGYSIGNDMSSRSIEGENALYLPQAKIYEKCAGLGPCLYVTAAPFDLESTIKMSIKRGVDGVFSGEIKVSQMKRSLTELADYLFRECDFPQGVFLMTGTCLVPPSDFTLNVGDVVEISIDGIGTLVNRIGVSPLRPLKGEL
jgi:2-dehydro-3-deoxy-D-arabinonate dehydratase